jgi:photosystem II stability/assembly factor-like uncharacterized protein
MWMMRLAALIAVAIISTPPPDSLRLGQGGEFRRGRAGKFEGEKNALVANGGFQAKQQAPVWPDHAVEGLPENAVAMAPPPGRGARAAAGAENFNALNVRDFLHVYSGDTENGRTLIAAVFDEGLVAKGHPEFQDGKDSRVLRPELVINPAWHPTGVASVMAAWGADPAAEGIARRLRLYSYRFDEDLTALRDVAKEVRVSNHSYVRQAGWVYKSTEIPPWAWYGDPQIDKKRDAQFGKYTKSNAELDGLLYENRHLLSFIASGNARFKEPKLPNPPPKHWEREHPGAEWKQTSEARDPNDSWWEGCDTIAGLGLSKNAICVGAATATDDTSDPIQVAPFSSWGPADDWRIKPDLIGVGDAVHVASVPPPTNYADRPGSSFACPAVAGVGALLVEFAHKRSPRRRWPTSAEIKAVMIHTARDAMRPGPDPETGWGMVNALEAGRVIREEEPGRILQVETITSGPTPNEYTYVRPDARQKRLRVTLVWTDPPAKATKEGLDVRTKTLVHDLDVELYPPGGGTPYYPYSLNQGNPRAAPTTSGRNQVDNVEVIELDAKRVNELDPMLGEWTVRVRGDRLPKGASQEFALVVSSLDERRQVSRIPRPVLAQALPQPSPPAPGVMAAGWVHLGPWDLGGSTRALLIHPTDRRMMWAGCSSGGLWHTDDGGLKWTPGDASLTAHPICTLVMDPTDPNVLYAGTGDGYNQVEARGGIGVFKSKDAGSTWRRLTATAHPHFTYLNRLAISGDGRTLLAATPAGLYRSFDCGESFEVAGPLHKHEIFDVDFHPTDPKICLAAGRNLVFRSNDGGRSFILSTGLPHGVSSDFDGRTELAFARSQPSIVYASVDFNNGELYRSTDGGRTFQLRNTGSNYLGNQGWFTNAIWAGDPTNSDLVVVGGLDLYRSNDAGRSLTQISQWTLAPPSPHAHHHVILERPGYNGVSDRVVFFGGEGGIYRNDDISTAAPKTGWHEMNKGYDAAVVHGAAGNPDSGVIVAGVYSQGTRVRTPDRPNHWTEIIGGDGGTCAADPTDPRFLYGGNSFLHIERAHHGGKPPELQSLSFIYDGIVDAAEFRSNFFAPFILDPNHPATMLAGGASLWRNTDVKAAPPGWSAIKEPAGSDSKHFINAIAVARGNSDIIWVGCNDGGVYVTTDGTAERPRWKRLGAGLLPPRVCTRIFVAAQDPRTVYATFGGYAPDNLWKTTDGGQTWRALGAGGSGVPIQDLRKKAAATARLPDDPGGRLPLPAVPIYALTTHPDNPNYLCIGNEFGVFMSEDGGHVWVPTNSGPTNWPVSEMFWLNKVLVVATRGRGVFSIDLSKAVR